MSISVDFVEEDLVEIEYFDGVDEPDYISQDPHVLELFVLKLDFHHPFFIGQLHLFDPFDRVKVYVVGILLLELGLFLVWIFEDKIIIFTCSSILL